MNFTISRDIQDKVFTTKIQFKSLGRAGLDAEEERKIYEDFHYPVIDLGGEFKGSFDVVDGKVVVAEEGQGQEISFVLNSKKVEVNEKFVAEYQISLEKIKDPSDGDILNTKSLIAEARCLLFEKVIETRIAKAIEDIMSKVSKFEDGYPRDIML